MSDPYIGEIRMFGGNFAPQGWSFCSGQLLSIAENDALYNLIGTTYGGDGQTTFGLPNLQSRVPIHAGSFQGQSYTLGQAAGSETVTVTSAQMPSHTHVISAVAQGADGATPTGQLLGQGSDSSVQLYGAVNADKAQTMAPSVVGSSGSSPAHDNIQPYLAVSFIIALAGIYPSQG